MIGVGAAEHRGQSSADDPHTCEFGADAADDILHACLDRIHRARKILMCYDLTATPFAPTGRKSGEETLFGWIVSDFGLNDAIESGLVKTPRVVVRDDGEQTSKYKSKFYHIYTDPEVKPDLNRKAEPHIPGIMPLANPTSNITVIQ